VLIENVNRVHTISFFGVALPTMLLGGVDEAADAFARDAEVVALHLFGKVAAVYKLSQPIMSLRLN